jgi:hypothetical protein
LLELKSKNLKLNQFIKQFLNNNNNIKIIFLKQLRSILNLLKQILPHPHGQHFVPTAHSLSAKQFNGVKTHIVIIPLVFGHFPSTTTFSSASESTTYILFTTGFLQTRPHPFEH